MKSTGWIESKITYPSNCAPELHPSPSRSDVQFMKAVQIREESQQEVL